MTAPAPAVPRHASGRPFATPAAGFLADARSRLLPVSVPFRYFGAAVFFHLLGWLSLGVGAAEAPSFAGGLAWPLAALHLMTLGVLVMTAMGASLQLLPVATRQPVASPAWAAALWWLYTPAVAALALAMALGQVGLLAGAAAAVVLALAGFAVLLARNLAGARGMPVVTRHGWAALGSLLVLMVTGLSLAADYHGHGVMLRGTAIGLHIGFAAYGFMGLLVLGFSYILVPMFALSDSPPLRPSLLSLSLALAGLALAALAAWGLWPEAAWPLAEALGAAALALHVLLMQRAWRSGMRRKLGRSFVLVRLGWAGLAASLLAALALEADWPRGRTLFVVLLIGALLSFLLGMLSRIVPFLASMHAAGRRRRAPLPSALTAERPLALHFGCHIVAWALLLAAVLADSPALATAAATIGSLGALAFGWFFVAAWRRMGSAGAAGTAGTA